jgi:hypothetical protein
LPSVWSFDGPNILSQTLRNKTSDIPSGANHIDTVTRSITRQSLLFLSSRFPLALQSSSSGVVNPFQALLIGAARQQTVRRPYPFQLCWPLCAPSALSSNQVLRNLRDVNVIHPIVARCTRLPPSLMQADLRRSLFPWLDVTRVFAGRHRVALSVQAIRRGCRSADQTRETPAIPAPVGVSFFAASLRIFEVLINAAVASYCKAP